MGSIFDREPNESDYMSGEHYVPEHLNLNEEDKERLIELRKKYIGNKLGKSPEEVNLD